MVKPGYKETEVGVIPKDWEITTWGEVGDCFSSGATPYRALTEYYNGNIKWVSSGELNYNVIQDTIEHISPQAQKAANLTLHPAGTFLMAITGLEAAGTRGSCAILGVPATTNQSCMAIYGTDKLDVHYLFYYYCSVGNELAFKYCQGTKQQSYTAKIVKILPIVIPPVEEQQKIAEALSDMDELIASLEKLIAKKKAVKQGAMQELLTGEKRLPGIDGEWKEVGLQTVADFPTSTIALSEIKTKYYVGTDNMVANRGGVNDNSLSLVYENVRQYQEQDILLSNIRPYLKKIWLSNRNGGCSNDVLVIRVKDKSVVEPAFLYQVISQDSFFDYVMANAVGTKMPRGDKNVIKTYTIKIPNDIQEQREIITILSDMDAEIEALEQKLAKCHQTKQGMMQQLLTGKIRLI